jgi:enoyl-CoA hydratase/carnithine racemase
VKGKEVSEVAELDNLEAAKFERIDSLAVVTLNRPEALNSLNTAMHRDVDACWEEINNNDQIRAAVVTGAGRFFCAGRDIKEYVNTYGGSGQLRAIDDPDNPLFGRLCNHYVVRKPLVCALNGPAVGAGVEIVIMCDMVVMAEDAYMADLHAKVNVGGMNSLLTFLPPMIARELTMTDRRLSAEECLRFGFVNRVAKREDVLTSALELARATTLMGPDSIRSLKEGSLKRQEASGNITINVDWEARRQAARQRLAKRSEDKDLMEGMKAFLEKRPTEYVKPS